MKARLSISALMFVVLFCGLSQFAYGKKDKAPSTDVVDQGSFGIFVQGQRVATERFSVRKLAAYNVTTTEIRMEQDTRKVAQSSELRLALNGDLQRYEWHSFTPEKAQTVLEPKDEFLTEHLTDENGKTSEQPYIMPVSSTVLDDFCFVQRELLMWRYLAENCHVEADKGGCRLPKTSYGVVIPRQRTSAQAVLEFKGRESVPYHGQQQQFDHFTLEVEGPIWDLWLDTDHKLVRAEIRENNTEIVRD